MTAFRYLKSRFCWFPFLGIFVICFYVLLVNISNILYVKLNETNMIGMLNNKHFASENYLFKPTRRIHAVDCAAIIAGNKIETEKAKALMSSKNYTKVETSDAEYIKLTQDCANFKRAKHVRFKVSREEEDFPIAYSILLYRNTEQADTLLRAIYRPNNIYCLHVDADSKSEIHEAIQGIASCFDNVFVVSRKEYVDYAGFTRLQADLNCMQDLLERDGSWKYFINQASEQFPLKTNRDIVEILKLYNGTNDIEGVTGKRVLASRFEFRHAYKRADDSATKRSIYVTSQKKDDIPFNVSIVKGSVYGVFSCQFVEFVIQDKRAREILDWFRDVYSPDEYYWATLHHNPKLGTPGAYTGIPDDKPWLASYSAWKWADGVTCAGKFVRGVCVFGIGDLQSLIKRKELFANKLYKNYEPLAMDCLEEWYINRTAHEVDGSFNTSYYQSLPFIKSN